MAGFFVIQI
jgi:hypothetical protein